MFISIIIIFVDYYYLFIIAHNFENLASAASLVGRMSPLKNLETLVESVDFSFTNRTTH